MPSVANFVEVIPQITPKLLPFNIFCGCLQIWLQSNTEKSHVNNILAGNPHTHSGWTASICTKSLKQPGKKLPKVARKELSLVHFDINTKYNYMVASLCCLDLVW